MINCSECNIVRCSPEDRDRCADQFLFEAGLGPDCHKISLRERKQVVFEGNFIPLTDPEAKKARLAHVLPRFF